MLIDICKPLLLQVHECKTWKPSIQVDGQPLHGRVGSYNLVDFFGLSIFLPDVTFPKLSTFRFSNFVGISDEKTIVQYLVERSMAAGTDLVIGQSYDNTSS